MILCRSRLRLRELFSAASSSSSLKTPFQFSLEHFYSAASSADGVSSHLMADYFVSSLGFSEQEAISASAKVSHLKCTKKPDSIINLLKKYGLDQTQIKNLISSTPQVLLHVPDETLESKCRLLQEIGLSGSDLVRLIKRYPNLLRRGLDTVFIPTISWLRNLLGSNENVVKAINKTPWVFSSPSGSKNISANFSVLQNYGFANDKIAKFIAQYPRTFMQNPELMKVAINRLEEELKVSRSSPMFFRGIHVLTSVNWLLIEKKFVIFRSFGWSHSDLLTMFSCHPFCMAMSEAKIVKGLNFFVKELEFTPAYMTSHPSLLMLSLERRVKPRNQVLEILKVRKLVKCQLYTVAALSESKFVAKYVLPYKDRVPDLYEIYRNSMR